MHRVAWQQRTGQPECPLHRTGWCHRRGRASPGVPSIEQAGPTAEDGPARVLEVPCLRGLIHWPSNAQGGPAAEDGPARGSGVPPESLTWALGPHNKRNSEAAPLFALCLQSVYLQLYMFYRFGILQYMLLFN